MGNATETSRAGVKQNRATIKHYTTKSHINSLNILINTDNKVLISHVNISTMSILFCILILERSNECYIDQR